MNNKRSIWCVFLLTLLVIVVRDSVFHFSNENVEAKLKVRSAQRHWNLAYSQDHVYLHSSMRYRDDFKALRNIVEPKTYLLTDLATSYYSAAELTALVPNVHRHHKRSALQDWSRFLIQKHACYLDQEVRRDQMTAFIDLVNRNRDEIPFRYILVNKDQVNRNLKLDCLSQTRRAMINNVEQFATQVYDGEFLRLYKIN